MPEVLEQPPTHPAEVDSTNDQFSEAPLDVVNVGGFFGHREVTMVLVAS
jgi:hypothetical protein